MNPHDSPGPSPEAPLRGTGLLPVLDLRRGQVVRGVAGQRAAYRPIVTPLAPTAAPLDVAAAIRTSFGIQRLYVADLDAIIDRQPQWDALSSLLEAGFELVLDAGLRTTAEVQALGRIATGGLVLGLESVESPEVVREVVTGDRDWPVGFSLDLMNGRPLSASRDWPDDPLAVADMACACGINFLIILDLAAVGMNRGPATLEICRACRSRFPNIHLITGGGIRTRDDVRRTQDAGADEVLVASALHDGRLL